MISAIGYTEFKDYYEYHGNTTIERTRKKGELTIWRDWIIFNSVEEASQYYHDNCRTEEGVC